MSSSTFGQNLPTLQRGLSEIAELLVVFSELIYFKLCGKNIATCHSGLTRASNDE